MGGSNVANHNLFLFFFCYLFGKKCFPVMCSTACSRHQPKLIFRTELAQRCTHVLCYIIITTVERLYSCNKLSYAIMPLETNSLI